MLTDDDVVEEVDPGSGGRRGRLPTPAVTNVSCAETSQARYTQKLMMMIYFHIVSRLQRLAEPKKREINKKKKRPETTYIKPRIRYN